MDTIHECHASSRNLVETAYDGTPARSSPGERTASPATTAATRNQVPGAPAANGLNGRAMQRVDAYIETHLGENFSLADLAAAACVSRFHFARKFRISKNVSPMQYVLNRRIRLAKRLLIRGDQRMAAIAANLGFCDQSHFTRSFRRQTGMSPRQFVATRIAPGHKPLPLAFRSADNDGATAPDALPKSNPRHAAGTPTSTAA